MDTVVGLDQRLRSRSTVRRPPASRGGPALGALGGGLGVIASLVLFYPLGRHPSVGGDTPVGLGTEVALGFIGGVAVCPLGGVVGALIGWRLRARPIRALLGLRLVVLAAALSVGVFVIVTSAVNAATGWPALADVSRATIQWFAAHGALAGTVATVVYEIGRRWLQANGLPRHREDQGSNSSQGSRSRPPGP